MKNKLHVKTGDMVVVISGKSNYKNDKKDGKIVPHKVIAVSPKEGKVIVEGANIVKKHVRPRTPQEQGGIVEAPAAMYASKVQLYCEKCCKPTRAKAEFKVEGDKKIKIRKCAKCGAEL